MVPCKKPGCRARIWRQEAKTGPQKCRAPDGAWGGVKKKWIPHSTLQCSAGIFVEPQSEHYAYYMPDSQRDCIFTSCGILIAWDRPDIYISYAKLLGESRALDGAL